MSARKYKLENFVGTRLGSRVVLNDTSRSKLDKELWAMQCDCGNIAYVESGKIGRGVASLQCRSCGISKSRLENPLEFHSHLPKYVCQRLRYLKNSTKHEYTVTVDYLYDLWVDQEEKCALSGVDICLGSKKYNMEPRRTASLDRIDSKQGYVPGNVQWVHTTINMMKNKYDQKDFIQWCTLVAAHKRTTE